MARRFRRPPPRRCNRPRRRQRQPPGARATIRPSPLFCRAGVSTKRVRKKRPGTSTSILSAPILIVSCGIYPFNDPGLGDAVLAALDAPPDFPIADRTLRDALTDSVSLAPAPDI